MLDIGGVQMEITTGMQFTVNLTNVDKTMVWTVIGVGDAWILIENAWGSRTNRLISQVQDDIENGRVIVQ